ncbi:MAG: (2Fe-2S)-binding protein [Candidatus Saccharimonas sp.]|nr:(2Fe-2S)-binding protein [Planctomycetaceae bacterium]
MDRDPVNRTDQSNRPEPPGRTGPGFNRRDFLRGSGAAVAATAMATAVQEQQAAAQQQAAKVVSAAPQAITLNVNGEDQKLNVEPRVTLMDALRNDLNLTGCKDVCDRSNCGACTVLIDGKPVYSCTRFAIEVVGQKIVTAESLHSPAKTDDVVNNFCKYDGMQCGFCTPGFVMAVRGFCNQNPKATVDDCRKGLGGNICRCGTYAGVLQAAFDTAQTAKGGA